MAQELLDRAICFATEAHAGQLRKDGSPFILHPLEDAAIVGTMTTDRAVLAAYGLAPDTPEPEIVAHLFKLYAEMVKKEKESRK